MASPFRPLPDDGDHSGAPQPADTSPGPDTVDIYDDSGGKDVGGDTGDHASDTSPLLGIDGGTDDAMIDFTQ